jgi:hypothetical protein
VKKDEVPQDQAKALGGNQKLMYAVDDTGAYTGVKSTGWEVEDAATMDAVKEIDRLCADALVRAKAGTTSPLEYHMYARRMEPATLSATTGFPGWRLKRHFRPEIFSKLPPNLMARYVDALKLTPEQLRALP